MWNLKSYIKRVFLFLALGVFSLVVYEKHTGQSLNEGLKQDTLYRLESFGFVLPAEAEDTGVGADVTCITEGGACDGGCAIT